MADSALSQTQFKSLCGKLYSLLTHRRASKEDVETPMDIPKTSEAQQQQQEEEKLQLHAYPNCDLDIWLRSCREEIIKPLNGKTTGTIPTWINGCLYRNGPGKMTYGENDVSHLFDSAGLLHGFRLKDGRVTYQARFVKSQSYVRNTEAGCVVHPEFFTNGTPDPCQSIFHKVSSLFVLDRLVSDNAMISVYPLGDELYAFAETPFIHSIDPDTMDTTGRENLFDAVGIVSQSSHPHITDTEGAYSMGLAVGPLGPNYVIINYPPKSSSAVAKNRIVARVNCSSVTEPNYMHSFAISENYFIIIEQPLVVRLKKIVACIVGGKPLSTTLKWRQTQTKIRLISRRTSKETNVEYMADAFFFLHTINAYEDDNHLVLDICCYKNAKMLDCMYIEALQNAQSNPDYASLFRGRPKRFVLPLKPQRNRTGNLNRLSYSSSTAQWTKKGSLLIQPEVLCQLGCETPRINYEVYNGHPYRYFYAISSDVDAENPGTLIKVDTSKKTCLTWAEPNVYASEPVFIAHPDAKSEDHGVVLSSLIWGGDNECRTGLLILDAVTWTELGRTEFRTPSPVPKCLHGWFLNDSR